MFYLWDAELSTLNGSRSNTERVDSYFNVGNSGVSYPDIW
jgi:hypothetical protein